MNEAAHPLVQFRLDGQVALVTGASRGIGEQIALTLAAAGADVAVTARSEPALEAVAGKVRDLGRRAIAVAGDITDSDFVDRLANRVVAELGSLTIWVSNAGGTDDPAPRPVADLGDQHWDDQLSLNLRSVFTGARAAGRVMPDEAAIITISSAAASAPAPRNAAYAAAKAGVNSLTASLALELAPRRIRVNAVAPGPVPTEVFMEFFDATEDDLPRLAEELRVPLGRLGHPEDVANAVLFLASPAAAWITGHVLAVDGGPRR